MTMISVVMILRVYAMYNRSRIILGILLVMYITEAVMLLVTSSIYSDPKYATSTYPTELICPLQNSAS